MKQLSLIVIHNKHADETPLKASSLHIIKEELQWVTRYLEKHNFVYEIVVVTDSLISISLEDIEIFPRVIPIKLYHEKGNKSMSDLVSRGISLAKYEYIGILGTTQNYFPKMFERMLSDIGNGNDVVTALKGNSLSSLPFPFKMRINPQNAALFFKKNVWETIKFESQNDKTFLIEFLKRAREAGFINKKYQFVSPSVWKSPKITFKEIIGATKDIITLSLKKIPPIYIPAKDGGSMIDAGIFYKKQQYITHTTLNVYQSALEAFTSRVIMTCLLVTFLIVFFLVLNPLLFTQVFIAVLSTIYLIDVAFNMFLVFRTFQKTPELTFSKRQLEKINDAKLPIYTILCPLYKEVHILPQFIKGLEQLDWPKDKLDVIILLESDDTDSIQKFDSMSIPSYIKAVIVPNSIPKTKPKACNYGLGFAKGTYTVIYDAEDLPDPLQLKKAYLGFREAGDKVACIQAKLNYYNSNQNWLTRFFTAEYSLWFDIVLTSLHSLKTVIPLGGTSNHFRTKDLKKLHAWDPFNVTEDADLGLRLFKLGFHTAILDSVTLEEGNSQVPNWIRQRSRWIKGYMQTYLVHTKENIAFFKDRGIHALIFHLVIGGKLAFIIINPFLWIVTLLYFMLYPIVGPTIDSFYPPFVLYVAITSLIFGNYLYLLCHIMGCVKKEQWGLIKYVFFIPAYWILISIAGFLALYQLIFKPFYWEKTVHGLHLKNDLSLNQILSPAKVGEMLQKGKVV